MENVGKRERKDKREREKTEYFKVKLLISNYESSLKLFYLCINSLRTKKANGKQDTLLNKQRLSMDKWIAIMKSIPGDWQKWD